jgi:hypothetical protein
MVERNAGVQDSRLQAQMISQGRAVSTWWQAHHQELRAQLSADAHRLRWTPALRQAKSAAQAAESDLFRSTEALQLCFVPAPAPLLQAPEDVDLADLPLLTAPLADLGFDLDEELDAREQVWQAPWNAPERVTMRERAHQYALELTGRYGWQGGVEILADILDRPRWGTLHRSLERLMAQGLTPDELRQAHELRQVFGQRPELNVTPTRHRFEWTYAAPLLRWSTALDLARQFPETDPECLIERLVTVCRQTPREWPILCWSDRFAALLEGFPAGMDGDYWLTVLEEL